MNILGVVPARGGSRSIPRKNIALVAGRPLLQYTCEAALRSKRLTRTILSTDDEEIGSVGRACGIEVPFLRPDFLAQDETPMVEVLHHAVSWLANHNGFRADLIVLLQPTSPLRCAEHIDAAVDLILSTNADTVVSVVEVPHRFSVVSQMCKDANGNLSPFIEGPMLLRRQDKPRLYARNGPVVLVIRRQVIESGRLYGDTVRPLEMTPTDSLDIDDADDLALAEFWVNRGRAPRQV